MTILYTEAIMSIKGPYVTLVIIMLFVFVISAVTFCIGSDVSSESPIVYSAKCISILSGLVLLLLVLLSSNSFVKVQTGEKLYVTIDDTMTFKELDEKYTVLDQKGDIYIVKEKNGTN